MKYYQIEAEVAGGFGRNTVTDRSTGKMVVKKLHYRFEGWLGDDLLESTPCYIVSDRLALEIDRKKLTGIDFDEVEISISEDLIDLNPNFHTPKFIWIKVFGQAGRDDFGMASGLRLIISERALVVLQRFNIQYAEIKEFN